jgi:hypothetical protein
MLPGPNASANVALDNITDVEAHHVLSDRRFAAPVALLCVQIRGEFVSEGAGVQFAVIDRTARGDSAHGSAPQYVPGAAAANTSKASFRTMDERGL